MTAPVVLKASDAFELPSKRDEDWRWTDLRGLIRTLPPNTPASEEIVGRGGPFEGLATDEFVILNGRANWWPDTEKLSRDVTHSEHHSPSAPLMAAQMPMGAMAAERAFDATQIVTIEGAQPQAVLLRWVSDAQETAHFGRFGLIVEAGASVVLLESYEDRAGSECFADYLIEIFVKPGGRVERIAICDDNSATVSIASAEVHLEKGAAFCQTILTSGAKRQRIETQVSHPGGGATVRLDGLYLLSDRRHADITTVVTHAGADGVTDQLIKGVVRDQARGVFQGRIVVSPGADKTDARMGHHALILSDKAEVDAKPELEIYADDVVCAHGNTVGALDEEALFYAKARGIADTEARAMLTQAFLGEVVDRIVHDGAREVARAWVATQLGAAR